MHIEIRGLTTIKPYENNPRLHEAGIDAVAQSLKEYGWRQPIVVDEKGIIVVGHTRFKAAQKLGMTEVPVHVASGLSRAQLQAYRIADNQTSTLSSWDDDKLTQELMDLQTQGYDLDLTGFSCDQLTDILNTPTEGLTDADAIPAPPDEAITQPGDRIRLGDHVLLCGDSASAADVDRLLAGATIQLVTA